MPLKEQNFAGESRMAKKALCLVTGGAGFIGSHMVEALLKRGYRVRVFDNLSTGLLSNIAFAQKNLEFQKGDIRDERAVRRAMRSVDFVFHFAACRAVLQSVDHPSETNDVNVNGTLKLLLAARAAKVRRFISASSSSVYGDSKKYPVRETDTPDPLSPYAASKIAGEYYCRIFYRLFGLETVCLRYFNVFGPRQNPRSKYAAVIPIFIEALRKSRRPVIFGDGLQSRDFTYVDNVISANLLAMKARNVGGEVLNVACHEESSVLDIFRGLKKILGIKGVEPKFAPARAGDIRRSFADTSKAKRMLRFRVQTRFYPGLVKTVDWFLRSRD